MTEADDMDRLRVLLRAMLGHPDDEPEQTGSGTVDGTNQKRNRNHV